MTITSDKAIVVGYFKKADGFAVMVVNTHNPFDPLATANVKFNARNAKAFHGAKSSSRITPSAVELTLPAGQGAFVTL